MEENRIFRFSYSGIATLAMFLLTNWLLGSDLFDKISNEKIVIIIGLLFSTPLIGFIVSSMAYYVVHRIWDHNFEIKFKDFISIKAIYLEKINSILTVIYGEGTGNINNFPKIVFAINKSKRKLNRINRNNNIRMLTAHQFAIRCYMPDELLNFCVRRRTIYWTHFNILSAIIFGSLISFLLLPFFIAIPKFSWTYFDPIKLLVLIPIVIYFISGVYQFKRARKEANEVEMYWIKNFNLNFKTFNKRD